MITSLGAIVMILAPSTMSRLTYLLITLIHDNLLALTSHFLTRAFCSMSICLPCDLDLVTLPSDFLTANILYSIQMVFHRSNVTTVKAIRHCCRPLWVRPSVWPSTTSLS